MQAKQKHNNKRRALQHRKMLKGIARGQRRLPKRKLSGRSGGKQPYDGSFGVASNHLLSLPVRTFNYFDAQTETEIDRFINGVYPCLLNIPGFNPDKQWDVLPSKEQLAEYLLSEVKRLTPKGYDWMVTDEMDEFAVYYYQLAGTETKYSCNTIEWLYDLKEKDKLLYELSCATIFKICSLYNLDIITDHYTDIMLDEITMLIDEDDDEDVIAEVHNCVREYKQGGKAYELYHYMKRQNENYSIKVLIDSILKLKKTKARLKGEVIEWLQLAIPCLMEPVSLDRFILNLDGWHDGALNLKYNYVFHYSFHDIVSKKGEEWRNDTYSNIGEMDPAVYYKYSASQVKEPAKIEPLKNLNIFMESGRGIYWRHFEKKYEKHYETKQREY